MQLSSTIEPKQILILPPGNITIRVYVCDVISSCTNYEVAQILVQPVVFSLDSSIAFSVDVGKAIQSGQVDKFFSVYSFCSHSHYSTIEQSHSKSPFNSGICGEICAKCLLSINNVRESDY